jgi:hypothetical protein
MDSFTNILSGMSRYESKLQFVEGEKAQLQQVLPNYLGNFLLQYSLPTIVVSDALYQKVTKNSIQYHTYTKLALAILWQSVYLRLHKVFHGFSCQHLRR